MTAQLPVIGGMIKVLPNGRKIAVFKEADAFGIGSPLVGAYQDAFGNTATFIIIDPASEAEWASWIADSHGIGNWLHHVDDLIDAHIMNFFGLYIETVDNATPYSANAVNRAFELYATVDWPLGGVAHFRLLA